MANELLVGLTIGASLSSSFQAAFGAARSTVTRLGESADVLGRRHARLGDAMARALAHPMRNAGALRTEYERLGRTIELLKERQDRLTASLARGESLRNMRRDLRSSAMETIGTAVAVGAPVVQSTRLAMGHQDRIRDIAITGDFSAKEEAELGNTARQAAVQWNQTQEQVAAGMGVLVAGGIQQAAQLQRYAPIMAKTATATRATMDDLGAVAIALNDNLKIGADGYESSMNMLAYAGKRGQFELADMAKWLPQLSPQFAALGVTGQKAVAEIGAALQIARKGAGSNDEAANNFKNFLSKITAPDTLKSFEDAGIDLKKSMQGLVAGGMTPMQAMLGTITAYMGTKGPDAARQLQSALEIKDENERQAAVERLQESYKLGELFRDMQVLSFLRPALANQAEQADIQRGAVDAAGSGVLDEDYRKRVETATEQLKSLRIGLADLGISVGNALLPPLVELVNAARPIVATFSAWAQANPGVVKGVVALVGGLLAGRVAVLAFRYAWVLGASALNFVGTGIATVAARLALLRAMVVAGRFAPLLAALRAVGSGAANLLGVLRSAPSLFGALARGGGMLAAVVGGRLLVALRLVGQAVFVLGRALLFNPIGLIVTAIGLAALVVYKYWQPIKAFFIGLWRGIATVAGPAIGALVQAVGGLGRAWWAMLTHLPGLGRFIARIGTVAGPVLTALASGVKTVAAWFRSLLVPVQDVGGTAEAMGRRFGTAIGGVIQRIASLPTALAKLGTEFFRLGTDVVNGLIGGIVGRLGAVRNTVVDMASGVRDWFKSALGIQSPSRVFVGLGGDISAGAALGITRGAPAATSAAADMVDLAAARAAAIRTAGAGRASALRQAIEPATDRARAVAGAAAGGQGGGGFVVHFSPRITVQGGDAQAVQGAVNQALEMSAQDFERLMRRVRDQMDRRAN